MLTENSYVWVEPVSSYSFEHIPRNCSQDCGVRWKSRACLALPGFSESFTFPCPQVEAPHMQLSPHWLCLQAFYLSSKWLQGHTRDSAKDPFHFWEQASFPSKGLQHRCPVVTYLCSSSVQRWAPRLKQGLQVPSMGILYLGLIKQG